jgi:hypothetical protein
MQVISNELKCMWKKAITALFEKYSRRLIGGNWENDENFLS